jgi:KDO2-lipid IV(A) lauroyltransferase
MHRSDLIGRGTQLGWHAAQLLPEPVADTLFRAAADRMFHRAGPSVRQLARNLGRVLAFRGPLDRDEFDGTLRDAVRSYARYWKETVRLGVMDVEAITDVAIANAEGLHHVEAGIRTGRGIVLAVPHSGNWDISGLIGARLAGSLTTVAERVQPESLFRRFTEHRRSIGMEVVPLTGGDVPATSVLTQRLRAGGLVCLPADRDLSGTGIEVDFFGARATMPPGPAMLAARTGADLCTVEINFSAPGGGWRNVVSAPIAMHGTRLRQTVTEATQQIAHAFERDIARVPADWHMMQPLWLDDPAHRGRRGTGTA